MPGLSAGFDRVASGKKEAVTLFIPRSIVPAWFIAFGLALMWAPMTIATGVILLTVGIVPPVVVLLLQIRVRKNIPVTPGGPLPASRTT